MLKAREIKMNFPFRNGFFNKPFPFRFVLRNAFWFSFPFRFVLRNAFKFALPFRKAFRNGTRCVPQQIECCATLRVAFHNPAYM